MAINLKFDLTGNPEPPTIILANRNGNKLGQLKVNEDSIELSDKFNDASELSFTINKYIDDKPTPLWEKVVDFKLVYCKEWDEWFEITVELDEETETVKTVFCTQLGQAELSQIMLYDIEINTEDDIARDDYKITVLYDEDDHEASLLHRLLKDKAPHYSIAYVSPTIAKIQRSFSFDGTSIYDASQEIAKEIGCIFKFYVGTDENHKLQRKIAVFDLQQYCNSCGHRGEYTDKCPKCGSTNITNGYGEDTLIFVTSDELASGGIQLTTDTDSVKNCFKLKAGDDLMTSTVRNCNPNGTDYIWYFSNSLKEDMADELVERLESYDELYKKYHNNYVSNLDTDLLNNYNTLVEKYSVYNDDLQKIETPIVGYSNLMNAYYNTIDLSLYLKSGLMPSVKMAETDAEEQGLLLETTLPSLIAVTSLKTVSLATANSTILAMAKAIVSSSYKVDIDSSELVDDEWNGNFIITNYSDEEDSYTTGIISRTLTDWEETFIKQKIEKILSKENTDDLSITGLFEKEYDEFCAELKKYALNPLTSFHDACQACIDILIDQGVGDDSSDDNLYEGLYLPYYNKLKAIEAEINVREDEINIILGAYDNNDNLDPKGLQTNIEECRNQIQNALDFKSYLGEELWLEFCAYRREDTYSNDNYISDGLNNAELFKKAQEFFEVAENEIYKSAELQHSISTTLNNLLAIPKFKPLVQSFNVGNWIRVQVNGEIYKLRLLEYEIDFGDFDNISVEFSDVTKIKNGITDVESILSQASSMATSYDSIQRQASQGDKAQGTINQWLTSGLNSALVRIQNNNNEDIILTKNGLLCRSYDDITGTYSPEQFKLTHNIMAYTTDNWQTVSSALGKHEYVKWKNNQWIKDVDYGLSSTFVTAGYVTGSQIIGGEIVSSNYQSGQKGTYFDLIDGNFELAGGRFVYDNEKQQLSIKNVSIDWSSSSNPDIDYVVGLSDRLNGLSTRIEVNTSSITSEVTRATKAEGELSSKITQTADSITSEVSKKVGADEIISKINQSAEQISISASKIKFEGLVTANNNFKILTDGSIEANNANISGTINATSGTFGGISVKTINGTSITSTSLNGGFDVVGNAKTDFDNLVLKNITAENIKATGIFANYLAADDIEAKYATIDGVAASYATIDSLDAVSARVTTIESNYITTSYLSTYYLTAKDIDTKFLELNTAQAGSITTVQLIANYIAVQTLHLGGSAIRKKTIDGTTFLVVG